MDLSKLEGPILLIGLWLVKYVFLFIYFNQILVEKDKGKLEKMKRNKEIRGDKLFVGT